MENVLPPVEGGGDAVATLSGGGCQRGVGSNARTHALVWLYEHAGLLRSSVCILHTAALAPAQHEKPRV